MRALFLFTAIAVVSLTLPMASSAHTFPLYVGTGGDGIYITEFDAHSGTLSQPKKVATTPRPTFLWIHRAAESDVAKTLYSVCEVGDGKGAIVAWAIGDDGSLTQRSQQAAGGDITCFVSTSRDGKYATVANYGSGNSVSLFPIKADGSLGPASDTVQHVGSSVDKKRQLTTHAHSSRFDPTDKRVLAADLGTDKVYVYDVGDDGSLQPGQPAAINMAAGTGPRHFTFSPNNKYLLVLGELAGTITTLRYDPPNIAPVETISTVAADFPADAARHSAEILFHPNGKWVYATNRGPSEIAVFDYDAASGKLKRTSAISSGGKHPRNFRFSPDGRFLLCANQHTNNIVVFSIDQESGKLTKLANEVSVDQPMCLKFLLPHE